MNFQILQKLPSVADNMYQQILLSQQHEQRDNFIQNRPQFNLPVSCCIRITTISNQQQINNNLYKNLPSIQQINSQISQQINTYLISSMQQDKQYYKNLKGAIQQFISGKEIFQESETITINNNVVQQTPFLLQTNDSFTIKFEVQNNISKQLVSLTEEQQNILQQNINPLSRLSIPRYVNNLELTKIGIELKSEISCFLQSNQQFAQQFENLNDKQLIVQKHIKAMDQIDLAILYYDCKQHKDLQYKKDVKYIDNQLLNQALKRFRFADFIYNTLNCPTEQYKCLLQQSKQLFGNRQLFSKTSYPDELYQNTLNATNAQLNILRDVVAASIYNEQKQ